jgi:hypothetical protein
MKRIVVFLLNVVDITKLQLYSRFLYLYKINIYHWRSRYGDWLRTGLPRGRSSSPYPMGTGALYPGVKWQGREADHSLPASAEVKKIWIYTLTPPYAFMA